MARIILEVGDVCEVEDNSQSGWNPESVDELVVTLVEELKDEVGNIYFDVVCETTGKTGTISQDYLHFKA